MAKSPSFSPYNQHYQHLQQRWVSRPWHQVHSTARVSAWTTVVLFMLGSLTLYNLQFLILGSRKALGDKYGPTVFRHGMTEEEGLLSSAQWAGEEGDNTEVQRGSYSRDGLWSDRTEWRRLGSGFEGETFVYNNTVVKTYTKTNSPFRNCVPGDRTGMRWPTEIEASLLLGGLSGPDKLRSESVFIPVVDYFLARDGATSEPKWHLVTPFISSGTLEKLAQQLRESERSFTARELDVAFRPSLEKLLDGLHTMHEEHDLCHDDVKIDNIFAAPENSPSEPSSDLLQRTHWMLADLGNARQVRHRYHESVLWSGINNNMPDCRSNDVSRLVKTYMRFLRAAVDDEAAFDVEFFEGREPWSQLFWRTAEDAAQGEGVHPLETELLSFKMYSAMGKPLARARLANCGNDPSGPLNRVLAGREGARAKAVLSLTKVSASENLVRRWGFSWLLGVPVTKCGAN